MTKEQEIVRSVFDAYIRDAKASSTKKDRPTFDMLEEVKNRVIKALEQPTTQDILSYIETGIIATGQSDSYCVGFCNALIWLKACITHEEPQYFEDGKGKDND